MQLESRSVASFDPEPAEGIGMPDFEPGAHVDPQVRGGPLNGYFVTGWHPARNGYGIAVDP